MEKLPVELIGAILEHLQGDKRSLGVCCTLSSRWVSSARYHLFYSLTIRGVERVCDLMALKHFPSPLTWFVKALTIDGTTTTPAVMDSHHDAIAQDLSLSALVSVVNLLPSLTILTLRRISLAPQQPPVRLESPCPQRSLKQLNLESVGRSLNIRAEFYAPDIHTVLSLFTDIGELHLSHMHFSARPSGYHPPPPTPNKPLPFTTLRINRCNSISIIFQNLRSYNLETLSHLSVESFALDAIGRFVHDIRGTLQHFSLDFGRAFWGSPGMF